MKITNKHGIPAVFVAAVQADPYSKGEADISMTSLIGPARIVALEAKHDHELSIDVIDRLASLKGQAIHHVLETAHVPNLICERRLVIEVAGWRVSGAMDAYDQATGTLYDYKTMSVPAFQAKFGAGHAPEEMETQLNGYAEMLQVHGWAVNDLKIIVWLEGWNKSEALRNADYPQLPILTFAVPMWPREKIQKYLHDRVVIHRQARVELPLCSATERWARPSQWALMKKGRKSALKLYATQAEATAHASTDPAALYVEHRPGQSVRCASWCNVSKFCSQWQESQNQKEPEIQVSEKVEVS